MSSLCFDDNVVCEMGWAVFNIPRSFKRLYAIIENYTNYVILLIKNCQIKIFVEQE